MKKKDINVEFIRVMACIIVIFCHTRMGLTEFDKSKILWIILSGDGVAFFFMLMGFFLFENDSYKKLLKKTALHILIPALIVMFLSRILYTWVMNQTTFIYCLNFKMFDWHELLNSLLNWSAGDYNSQHLWYIFSYFQVILLFPILKLLCPGIKNINENKKTFKIEVTPQS